MQVLIMAATLPHSALRLLATFAVGQLSATNPASSSQPAARAEDPKADAQTALPASHFRASIQDQSRLSKPGSNAG